MLGKAKFRKKVKSSKDKRKGSLMGLLIINIEWSYFLALLLLFLVLLIRVYFNQPLLALDYSYSFLTNANTNFFSLLLKPLLFMKEYLVFISCFAGLLSLFLFQKVVEESKLFKKKFLFYSNLLFITNPLFLSTFTTLNEFILIIPLSLFLLLITLRINNSSKKNKFYYYEPFISSATILFLSIISFEAAILLSILLLYLSKKTIKKIAYLVLGLLSTILGLIFGSLNLDIINTTRLFAELGTVQMPSIFIMLLGLFSFNKVKNLFFKISTFFLIICYYYSAEARWFLAILTIYFSVQTILYLSSRKWVIDYLKKATLLLIYCSLLFIVLSSMILLVNSQPTYELSVMKDFGMQESKTIVPEEIQYSANYFTHSKVLISTNPEVKDLYSSIRMSKARKILNHLQAKFIIITKEQKKTEWSREDEGLLFLLDNTDDFIKITDGKTLELWEYRPLSLVFK